MALPIVRVAWAWALGIVLAAWLEPPISACLLLGVAALGGGLASASHRRLAASLAALAGGALALVSAPDIRNAVGTPREVTVEGRVLRVEAVSILLDQVRGPAGPALPETLRLHDVSGPGAGALAAVREGSQLRARVRLRPGTGLRNPGDPLAWRWWRPGPGQARLVHPSLWVEGAGAPPGGLTRLRERVSRRLQAEGPGGGLLAALSAGRREGLPAELRAHIGRMGLGHLLAVSGLHLALVAGGSFALALALLRRSGSAVLCCDVRRLACGVAWLAASLYAVFCGAGAPVQRAWVCLSLPLLALFAGRGGHVRIPLSAAALLLLVRDPLVLFSPGAQLSFAASAALAHDLLRMPRAGALHLLLRASATATLATAPIAAFYFAPASPAGLLLNLVAIPWMSGVLLPLALAAATVAAVPVLAASPLLGWLCVPAALSLEAVSEVGALIAPERPAPGIPALVWAGGAACVGLCCRSTLGRVLAALLVTSLLGLAPDLGVGPRLPRLVVFDVGQGDALLVQGREASVLVDAGVALPEGPDRGRDVVLPGLAALGVTSLDLLVVTHADLDHRGGVPAVLEGIEVEQVWLPYGAHAEPGFGNLLAVAARRGARVEEHGADAPGVVLGDLEVVPLWPLPGGPPSGPDNDRSLVVRVRAGGVRVLLPGDLEAEGEAALLARGTEVGADVLVLPHHGSRTSSSAAFLRAVAPRVALASAPCLGRFGMPHAEVVARLAARRIPLWWTGRDGALVQSLSPALPTRGLGRRRPACRREEAPGG